MSTAPSHARRVARSLRAALSEYRRLPRLLLVDSALSNLGYRYATAVGFVWGFLWSVGRVERREGLWVFREMPRRTFGRGGSCVGGCYFTDHNVTDDVLEHEAVHKRQWQRYGMLFPVLYGLAGPDPQHNRFEIEAGLEKGGYR
ncbi:Fe-S oxidoreductase [Humibacter ginsengisoli]